MDKFLIILLLGIIGCMNKSDMHLNKASAYFKNNENNKALEEISKVIATNSSSIDAYILKGEIENSMGLYPAAYSDLRKAFALDSFSKTARFNLGISCYFLDKNDSAIILFNSIINQNGNGQFYFDSDKKEQSISHANVPMVNLKYFRGLSYYHNNMNKNAIEDFAFCLDKNFNTSIVKLYVGMIYIESGMKEKGCKYLNQAQEEGNLQATVYINKSCK